ncbi:MAG TPA: NAD-dependent epimerase/dehydratase family protein [Gaiellaceae bacterium]|nr:NAD-dependent epimerase/dehydratase family protein [Gaiellaceae bacterium]
MTRVLVTGGAGFIGSHTVDLLLERGYDVRILDSLQPRVHPNGKPPWLPADAEFLQGDVADRDDLSLALAGVDAVFHLAAYQDYLPDFSTFVHTNTESSALLFELIVADPARHPVEKIVFASSQAVSGEGKYSCPACERVLSPGPRPLEQLRRGEWEPRCDRCGGELKPELIDEGTSHPHTAYGVSKYAIELLAFALGHRYGIATAAMRYTYVQGPRNSFHNAYSGIARRFALRLRAGLPPVCYEDGAQLRDYVNVRDVARANLLALESDVDGVALNVGGGRAVTVREFAQLMVDTAGAQLEPEIPGEFRVGDTRHTVSDISRMRALDWEPEIPVEQNVREYLEWLDGQDVPTDNLFDAEREMAASGVVQRAG